MTAVTPAQAEAGGQAPAPDDRQYGTATPGGGPLYLAIAADAMDLWHGGALMTVQAAAAAGHGEVPP